MGKKRYCAFRLSLLLLSTSGMLFGAEGLEGSGESDLEKEPFYKAIYDKDLLQIKKVITQYPNYNRSRELSYACELFGFTRVGRGCLSKIFQNPSVTKEIAIIKALIGDKDYTFLSGEQLLYVYRREWPPLHVIAKNKSSKATEIAYLLLKAGASVNEVSRYGQSPLIIATKNYNVSMVTLLLKHAPTADTIFNVVHECIHKIALCYAADQDKAHLKVIARMCILNHMRSGFPQELLKKLLFEVCEYTIPEIVECFFEIGANPHEKTRWGEVLFLQACKYSGVEVLQLFLNAGADLEYRDASGNGPLHWAARGYFRWKTIGTEEKREIISSEKSVEFLLSNPQKREESPLLAGLFE